ncbi:MAG TPA: DNA alkylation repair protein [Candidatus Limnocylindrales bacterium]
MADAENAAANPGARSDQTANAVAFVAARRDSAEQLGAALGELISDPDAFALELRRGLTALADPSYIAMQRFIAPGIGPVLGVRWPLNAAVARGFRRATRGDRPSQLLFLADRLFREEHLELRWFAFGLLEPALPSEPERTWQLMRRAAREANDWITVDSLAHPYARGILLEAYRWAELEQLVFSRSRWERRLVGSTIATMPFLDRTAGREAAVARRALTLIGDVIGDDEADVQKALSWALRSMLLVDAAAVEAFCRREAALAAESNDGHRAWVIRDVLGKLPDAAASEIRAVLGGVRRRAGVPATSRAADVAARFGDFTATTAGSAAEPPLA